MLESRIPSEKTRRLVIALIMGCLLAAATGWAAYLSSHRSGSGTGIPPVIRQQGESDDNEKSALRADDGRDARPTQDSRLTQDTDDA